MDIKFHKFAEEQLAREVSFENVKEALFLISRKRDSKDPTIVEIMDLNYIWMFLPNRGKSYYVIQCNLFNDQVEREFYNISRISYIEYILKVEERIREINRINLEETDEEEYEEYFEDIISENDYYELTDQEYFNILNITPPRKTSPYIFFCKNFRDMASRDIERYSDKSLSYSQLGLTLGEKWANLPEKGKLDY